MEANISQKNKFEMLQKHSKNTDTIFGIKKRYAPAIIILILVFLFWSKIKSALAKIKLKLNPKGSIDVTNQITNVDFFQVASEIYAAHYKNDWFGITEDEQAAYNALIRNPPQSFDQISNAYTAVSEGKNLTTDINKFWNNELKAQFQAWLASGN